MLNAVRTARAQRPSLFSYSYLPNHTVTRKPSGVRFAQSVSGPKQPDSSDEMDPKQDHETKTRDAMSSFGEGYATRSDEEGFGGIYGGNQYLRKDGEDKNVHGKDPEFDHSQGSEVKEKEKARNQS
ncbi:hypothetical protein PHJA_002276500 [Phtheirospermum japonicum]|uniref:Late embryogenesis abundant protein n=1 Tax=Phtheirospermum japonicum TaxID=374723 RepID=A0A830D271_9LAMI|nr:hypothetical protein PHJA_002276500 [Phtheirospermum japonicum]